MGRSACIIANDVPEHREVLADAGLYYARNDPAALAASMIRVRDDAGLRAGLAEAAGRRAAEQFSWDSVADAYERLFERLLGTPDPLTRQPTKPAPDRQLAGTGVRGPGDPRLEVRSEERLN
jgi:hypothetical protein